MAKRSSGEEEKDSSRARETRPTGPEDQGVERPIWQEPRPQEREGVPDTGRAGFDVGPITREGADIVDPIHTEGGDEGDTAAVVWPQFDEGPESIDAETEDADWDDDAPEMEAEVDIDEDVDTHADVDEDVDTYEDVDVDIDSDDEDEEDIES